jgi:hypothetical protein
MTDGWPIEKAAGKGATSRGRNTDVEGLSLANQVMPPQFFKEPANFVLACKIRCKSQ